MEPTQLQDFIHEKTACVAGIKTVQRFGWKIGDKITLQGAMWPCDLELTLRGVYSGSLDDANLFFHHVYLDELLGDKGFTGLFWIRATDPQAASRLLEQIDPIFANSDAETVTAGLFTVKDAVDELLLELLSGGEPAPEAIVAVLLMVAPLATLQLTATTTVNWAVSPLAIAALVQVIVPVPPAGMVLQVQPAGFD